MSKLTEFQTYIKKLENDKEIL